jgi:hypothetical protein
MLKKKKNFSFHFFIYFKIILKLSHIFVIIIILKKEKKNIFLL